MAQSVALAAPTPPPLPPKLFPLACPCFGLSAERTASSSAAETASWPPPPPPPADADDDDDDDDDEEIVTPQTAEALHVLASPHRMLQSPRVS